MKRRLLIAGVACSVLVFTEIRSRADFDTNQLASSKIAATNNLAQFRKFISPKNHLLLGFPTLADVTNAVVGKTPEGDAFQIYRIPTARLTNYNSGDPVTNLLTFVPEIIYPVTVGTNVESSLRLRLDGNTWRMGRWGDPDRVKRMAALRANIRATAHPPIPEVYIVEIPVISLSVVGYYDAARNFVLFTDLDLPSRAPAPGGIQSVDSGSLTNLARIAKQYPGKNVSN